MDHWKTSSKVVHNQLVEKSHCKGQFFSTNFLLFPSFPIFPIPDFSKIVFQNRDRVGPPTMYNVLCTMYDVQCTMCDVQCTMYNVQCTMYDVQCTMDNVRRTMYEGQCTMYNVRCKMYDVQCTMYNVRCTMYNVHRKYLPEKAKRQNIFEMSLRGFLKW